MPTSIDNGVGDFTGTLQGLYREFGYIYRLSDSRLNFVFKHHVRHGFFLHGLFSDRVVYMGLG